MPAVLINFPFSAIVDGILSFLHYSFKTPGITPSEYRWDPDDRKSFIRICAPFVIDNEKPMSAPFIVVERGAFQFANRAIDNLKNGEANIMERMEKVDWADGTVNIICGSGVAGEASSLANFIAILMQSERHGIASTLRFVRNLKYLDVSPEIPIVKNTEVRRWEVTLRIFVSLQMGWLTYYSGETPWNKAGIKAISPTPLTTSNVGRTTQGSDLIVDTTKNFGFNPDSNPRLLQPEVSKGWYYLRMPGLPPDNNLDVELFTLAEVVDNHTLRVFYHDAQNQLVPWSAPATATNFQYELLWNNLNIHMEFPKP